MVFANLTQRDKDAFFALLDEYFASRPHLFNGGEAPSNVKVAHSVNGPATNVTKSSVANAFAPRTTQARPAPPPRSPRPAEPALAQEEEPEETGEEEEKPVSVASRVAAAQAALKATPPLAPRRTSANSINTSRENSSTPGSTGSAPSGLVSSRSIGNMDTTSKGGAVSSLFKKSQAKPGTGPVLPSAFPPKEKGGFAPPPQRAPSAGSGTVGKNSPHPARATPPAPVEEPEEEEYSGEWAEALYEFSSSDSTDLSITAGERLLITERNSKDWWTAESDTGRGLVPAAYVKIL